MKTGLCNIVLILKQTVKITYWHHYRTSTSSWDTFHIVGVFHLFVFINNKMRIEHHESFDCQQYSILFLITGHGNVLQNSTVKCEHQDF